MAMAARCGCSRRSACAPLAAAPAFRAAASTAAVTPLLTRPTLRMAIRRSSVEEVRRRRNKKKRRRVWQRETPPFRCKQNRKQTARCSSRFSFRPPPLSRLSIHRSLPLHPHSRTPPSTPLSSRCRRPLFCSRSSTRRRSWPPCRASASVCPNDRVSMQTRSQYCAISCSEDCPSSNFTTMHSSSTSNDPQPSEAPRSPESKSCAVGHTAQRRRSDGCRRVQ